MNRRECRDKGDLSPWNDSPLKRASFFEPGDESPGDLTGIILAGGASRRMGGRNKAFLELDGRPLIEIVIERVQSVCAEVLIVAGDTGPYAGLGAPLIEDRFRGVGVLGGLHAGLEAASHDLTLVVGCDMPFLNPDLLRAFAGWAEGVDVAVLRQGKQVEPLHAAYRRTCLPAIETAIRAGERRIVSFFPHIRVRYVAQEEITPIDPDLRSFQNVNTPDEWARVQA
jgi:molybdenum cofactor guanylyltransferase